MASIKFIIKNNSPQSTIYVRFKQSPIDLTTKTNYAIDSKNWSSKKGKPNNPKSAELKQLDKDLQQLSVDLLNHYNKSVGKKTLNSQWLKDFINPPQTINEIPNNVIKYFDYYLKHKENELSKGSSKKFKVIKALFERFETSTKREYLINDINPEFKLSFENYCRGENYAPNTITRSVKFIKTIARHARNNGIESHHQLDNISAKYLKTEEAYLSFDEIKKIEKTKLDKDHLITTKDWLLISCETGQRISDFMNFNKDQIRYENGKPLIEFTQEKTKKIMVIPLSKKVMTILKKRKGNFPTKLSDQKYNIYLKEVCKIAKLTNKVKGSIVEVLPNKSKRKINGVYEKWKLVHSHIGRRSFATNHFGIIPTPLLMVMTGHSTERQFLEYIGKTDTHKALQLAEYF